MNYLAGSEMVSAGREQDMQCQQSQQSPSPTHQDLQPQRSDYGHRRRDSDMLRSLVPSLGPTGSPTVMDSQRVSPPLSARLQTRNSPPSSSVSTTPPHYRRHTGSTTTTSSSTWNKDHL
jgi:hypothetical protein